MLNEYELLDSGDGRKLERFGDVILSRPCATALWQRETPEAWARSSASFDREGGWEVRDGAHFPSSWVVTINGIKLQLKPSPAGHLGVFPETRPLWDWITETLKRDESDGRYGSDGVSVLNLFAYSGGATLAAARAGCSVCHLDASRSMVNRARENAGLNQLDAAPIRWIVEDVSKFLDREIRRGRRYDAIMLDPPSFGHGVKGEQYRIDRDLNATLGKCAALLSDTPRFVLLTSHTQGVTTRQLEGLLGDIMPSGSVESGPMELTGTAAVRPVNAGNWSRWEPS